MSGKPTKIMEEIHLFLGHKPKNRVEYKKAYTFLFGTENKKNRDMAKIQRRRHLGHTGPANITRKYCPYCEL